MFEIALNSKMLRDGLNIKMVTLLHSELILNSTIGRRNWLRTYDFEENKMPKMAFSSKTLELRVNEKFVKNLRVDDLSLSQEEFAHLLGVSLRSISRWEQGIARPDSYLEEKLLRLQRVTKRLRTFMDTKNTVKWLQNPHPELRGVSPVDLLGSEYATEELVALIEQWVQGTPG